jgi:hypothetical protein
MAEEPSRVDQVVDTLVAPLLRTGIDGLGPLDSAQELADAALRATGGDAQRAIDVIVTHHVRLAAAEGFLTGLGGFVTLPVALPLNVFGFYVLATRMVAATAALRGHDITKDETRTAILLTLTGDDPTEMLRVAGGGAITSSMTSIALRGMPPTALMAVNKAIAFRIFVRIGTRGLSRFGRLIPVVGGFVGAGLDAYLMRRVANHAREQLAEAPEPILGE